MPVAAPPIAAIRQNQASARMNAALSAFTSWASPCPTSCSSARGATAAQMSPAATPSTALPARAAANVASRPFVGTPYGRSAPARSYLSAPVRLDGVYLGQDRRDRVECGRPYRCLNDVTACLGPFIEGSRRGVRHLTEVTMS